MPKKASWKTLFEKCKLVVRQGRSNLFDLFESALTIWDDRTFRQDVELLNDYEAAEWLDIELFRDVNATFL